DRGPLPRVAWIFSILGITACGPTVKVPSGPAPEPTGVVSHAPTKKAAALAGGSAHQVLLGEMCPAGAGGRPAIAPLVLRNVGWTDNPADLTAPVERGSAPRWSVLGVDGKLAGAFDTMGVVDVGLPQQVAAGAYAGSSPCSAAAAVSAKPKGEIAMRTDDAQCKTSTAGCGIAIAELTHPDEPVDSRGYVTGGACITGNVLAVDIDGDGRVESFPLAGVLDGSRAPSAEWTALPTETAACKPSFATYGVKLGADAEPGRQVDPKQVVMMDVLGVVDLDGDGRRELVLALQFQTIRTIVVYAATAQAQRLELAGEAQSFAR
ncbi:MAG TPA: hypothetical protein VGC41_29540, partial [Kofleriaceae bacterium]